MSQYNQYSTPQSQVDRGMQQQFGEAKIFSVSGRIGRVRFLAYCMGVYLLVGVTSSIAQVMLMGPASETMTPAALGLMGFVVLAQLVFYFMFAIQRSHDMNTSGWLSLIILIPLIGFLVFLIAPGTRGENNYGLQPPPNNAGVIILAFLIPIAVIGILAAIAIPAYQGYIERAQENQQQQQYEQPR